MGVEVKELVEALVWRSVEKKLSDVCRLSFSLICSLIMCVRGARSSLGHPSRMAGTPVNLVSHECHVPGLVTEITNWN